MISAIVLSVRLIPKGAHIYGYFSKETEHRGLICEAALSLIRDAAPNDKESLYSGSKALRRPKLGTYTINLEPKCWFVGSRSKTTASESRLERSLF